MTPQTVRPEDRRRRVEAHPWADLPPTGFRSEAFAEDLPDDEATATPAEALARKALHTPGH